ncbi:MAG: SGNH/GDSL hydrolase family protein [Anaerolineae bacterium]|nr:SGNH/GDSL hydrolase family protein [Anaerolineae bacterium]
MPIPDRRHYLADVIAILKQHWPDNRTVNVVCHGHSVPAGYFATPMVDTFSAYPHLLHLGLKQRFPFAVINVIVTAVGGETSDGGAARFEDQVLCHQTDVLTLDYGLNDRGIGLEQAKVAWCSMIEKALEQDAKVLLLTPTADISQDQEAAPEEKSDLQRHAAQIRGLADTYGIGLADSLAAFEQALADQADLSDLLSWPNHPNQAGHELVARELLRWFPIAANLE